jgi:hypothetical protein
MRKNGSKLRLQGEIILLRRTLPIMLVGTLMSTLFGARAAHAKDQEEMLLAEKALDSVARMGIGKDTRVEVKLKDSTKLKGYISETGEDSFTVTDSKTGTFRIVPYADVIQANRQGSGFSTLTKVIIGAAIATGVIVGWQIVKPALCDGGAQHRGPC